MNENTTTVAMLRQMTGVGMMKCKKALDEAGGNLDKAVDLLRQAGVSSLVNRSAKTTSEGVIAQYVSPHGQYAALVEVNCETDFVARNDEFKAFASEVARKIADGEGRDLDADRAAIVAKMGENIKITRFTQLRVTEEFGIVASYIHLGNKVGALVELQCGRSLVQERAEFKQLAKDLTLQIAAASPVVVDVDDVPLALIAKERELAAGSDRLKGKPAQVTAKIVDGMLDKFYQGYCLTKQPFVRRNGEVDVASHVCDVGVKLNDEILIKRFVRFQVGQV